MKILAIDPGVERVGVAIIEKIESRKEAIVYSNCFKTSPGLAHVERLVLIGNEIQRILVEYSPSCLAIEKLYFENNQKTVMSVAEARGVVLYECAKNNLKVFEYTPMQIKLAIAGHGRASKADVYNMTQKLIELPNKKMIDDEIDAIAIGLTSVAIEKFR